MGKIGLILTGIALYAYKEAEKDVQYFQGLQRDIQDAIDMQGYIPGSSNDEYITEHEIEKGTELEHLPVVQEVKNNDDIEEEINGIIYLYKQSTTGRGRKKSYYYTISPGVDDSYYTFGAGCKFYLYPNEKKPIEIKDVEITIKYKGEGIFEKEIYSGFTLQPDKKQEFVLFNYYLINNIIQELDNEVKTKIGWKIDESYSDLITADVYYKWRYAGVETKYHADENVVNLDWMKQPAEYYPFGKNVGYLSNPEWYVALKRDVKINLVTKDANLLD